jgi:hypothetical protein
MPTVKYTVTLTQDERTALEALTTRGKCTPQKMKNALILLNVDRGEFQTLKRQTDETVCGVLDVCATRLYRVKRQFVENSLEEALTGKTAERKPRRCTLDGDGEARLVALACSTPPEGCAKWTLRLLADRLVDLHIVEAVSYGTVRNVLKKKRSSLG